MLHLHTEEEGEEEGIASSSADTYPWLQKKLFLLQDGESLSLSVLLLVYEIMNEYKHNTQLINLFMIPIVLNSCDGYIEWKGSGTAGPTNQNWPIVESLLKVAVIWKNPTAAIVV